MATKKPAPVTDLNIARQVVAQLENQMADVKRTNPSFELQYLNQRAEELRAELRKFGAVPAA